MKYRKGEFLLVRINKIRPALQATISNRNLDFAECTINVHSDEDRQRKATEKARQEFMDVMFGKTKRKRRQPRDGRSIIKP
jgi:hypothetical protein